MYVLHIGSNNPELTYNIDEKHLVNVDSQRDLEIYITRNMKWDVHVLEVTKKAKSILYILRKAFK